MGKNIRISFGVIIKMGINGKLRIKRGRFMFLVGRIIAESMIRATFRGFINGIFLIFRIKIKISCGMSIFIIKIRFIRSRYFILGMGI